MLNDHFFPILASGLFPKLLGKALEPRFNSYFVNIVVLIILSAFYVCFICSNVPQNNFTIVAIIMNPDQTTPKEQSDLCPHVCNIGYLVPKYISR